MKKLRPLRIFLALLVVVLFLLVLDYAPRVKTSIHQVAPASEPPASSESANLPVETSFLYLPGFSDLLETDLETRLVALGVPEEEFDRPEEYLDKDELFVLETRATLASELDANWVLATPAELETLRDIFSLDASFSFAQFSTSSVPPEEYRPLADLLAEYHQTLTTVEDYDLTEEELELTT
ncbi:hypothetical protein IJI72_02655 [Candidatus Saccharibacteria bacterium]|nr:hypothetical protein [Candidatus Saccharibacteria bacterium]